MLKSRLSFLGRAAGAMDPVEQRVKPVEVELGRNLQTYLQRLLGLSAPGQVAPSPT